VLGEDRGLRATGYAAAAAAAGVVLVLAGCTSSPDAEQSTPSSPSSSTTPSDEATTAASPPARPEPAACYRLTRRQAVAPVAQSDPVPCRSRHTSQTFHVGTLDLVRDGHLLAVDSDAAQSQGAETCPDRLPAHVGGGQEALRLSMVTSVWFTPSVEEAGAGADWFRCDLVALGRDDSLVPLPQQTQGLLASTAGRNRFGMCGTAEPGTDAFDRVPCGSAHSWRAVSTVNLPDGRWPSAAEAGEVMEGPCRAAARSRADDPLDFAWSEERPTREQWRAGRRYGICWIPD
jgi:hypothetical protein